MASVCQIFVRRANAVLQERGGGGGGGGGRNERDSWSFYLVEIVIDLVLIGLMTIIMIIVTPAGYLIYAVLHIASGMQNILS